MPGKILLSAELIVKVCSSRHAFVDDHFKRGRVRRPDDEVAVGIGRRNAAVRQLLRRDKSRSVRIACWNESGLLLCQLLPESFFPVGDVTLVARRIDERCYGTFFQSRVFRLHIEVTTVRPQKNVDR